MILHVIHSFEWRHSILTDYPNPPLTFTKRRNLYECDATKCNPFLSIHFAMQKPVHRHRLTIMLLRKYKVTIKWHEYERNQRFRNRFVLTGHEYQSDVASIQHTPLSHSLLPKACRHYGRPLFIIGHHRGRPFGPYYFYAAFHQMILVSLLMYTKYVRVSSASRIRIIMSLYS
jgi:hypothetical protein